MRLILTMAIGCTVLCTAIGVAHAQDNDDDNIVVLDVKPRSSDASMVTRVPASDLSRPAASASTSVSVDSLPDVDKKSTSLAFAADRKSAHPE